MRDYIKRDIENLILQLTTEYSCILVSGPRQVGKTTMLKKIKPSNMGYISLDDLNERSLAKNDPAMFLSLHPAPILIDEVQYAPELFSYIKIAIDNGIPAGSFWLTGSQSFKLMELAQESLAGRVALLHMSSLTQHELFGSGESSPFSLNIENIQSRQRFMQQADTNEIYNRIWSGSLPGHASGKFTNRDVFYSSYIQTYVERDIKTEIKGVDELLFSDFIRNAQYSRYC